MDEIQYNPYHVTQKGQSRFKDITGRKFGRLTAVKRIGRDKWNHWLWEFNCDCGTAIIRPSSAITTRNPTTHSCGCLARETTRGNRARTHGLSKTKEHNAWISMRQRCLNPKNPAFKGYGGRGITVCHRWNSFQNFISDMGRAPSPSHSIERRNNNDAYTPDNCYWTTQVVQCNNQRKNRFLTHNNQTLSVSQWSKLLGIATQTLFQRLDRGWPVDRVLTPFKFLQGRHGSVNTHSACVSRKVRT